MLSLKIFLETTYCILDVDECATGSSGCGQLCVNTVGGFHCTCNAGYTLDITDYKTCIRKFFIEINCL